MALPTCVPPRRLIVLAAAILVTGCRVTPAPSAVPCPLPLGEQQRAVDDLLPEGITRDEALRRLREAGLTGRFGATQSIYYLDTWARPEGEWLMEVAVLFDERGALTAVRPADSEAVAAERQAEVQSSPPAAAPPGRDKPRTPFAESDGL